MRAFALALLAVGCAPSLPASYQCTSDAQCRFGGQQGRCEATAACSFPDAGCLSGSRYGQFAPPGLAGACVDVANNDLGSGGGGGGGGGDGGGGPTHIVRVGSASMPRAMRTTVTLPPIGTTGDFLLACVLVSSSTVTVTPPAGWTVHQEISDNVAGDYRAVYFQHFAALGDLTFTFTLSATANVAAAEVVYRNVDPTTPIDAAANARFQGATFVAPSITTTHANDYLVTMFVQAMSGTLNWVPPTDMQVAVTAGDIGIFDVEQPVAGPTGTKTASFGIGSVPGVGAVDYVALTPKP